MSEVLVLGNIITMDDKKEKAEAIIVKDGIISYVGEKKRQKNGLRKVPRCWTMEKHPFFQAFWKHMHMEQELVSC